MKTTYKAIAFSPDGDYITEGEYTSVEQAWDAINNWGSRWIFYPYPGVVKNKRVVQMCDGLDRLSNKNINTISRVIASYQDNS